MRKQEEMSKPTLFMGSSKESKWIMHEMQGILSKYCVVKSWDIDVFQPGDFALESLHREVLLSDFALLIIYPDDVIIKRDESAYTARDNVLFELGLFMGVFGRHRTFCLLVSDKSRGESKEVLIPSDLKGLTTFPLTILDNGTRFEPDLKILCNSLKDRIREEIGSIDFTLLPSTSLAIGYFNNFVSPVCAGLVRRPPRLEIGGKLIDFSRGNFILYIVLPDKGADVGPTGFYNFIRDHNLQKIEIPSEFARARSFPFYIDSLPEAGRIALYDYPTTLSASWDAIKLISERFHILKEEREKLEYREIKNFEQTIRELLGNRDAADFRNNISIVYADKLEERIW